MVKFSNTTPLPLTIFGEGGLKTETGNFGGGSKTETGNSETGNNIWGGLKTETGNFGEGSKN